MDIENRYGLTMNIGCFISCLVCYDDIDHGYRSDLEYGYGNYQTKYIATSFIIFILI